MKQPPDDPWFVYILRCADGSLDTGITKDVKRRFERWSSRSTRRPEGAANNAFNERKRKMTIEKAKSALPE